MLLDHRLPPPAPDLTSRDVPPPAEAIEETIDASDKYAPGLTPATYPIAPTGRLVLNTLRIRQTLVSHGDAERSLRNSLN